jgi:hypothetical protein
MTGDFAALRQTVMLEKLNSSGDLKKEHRCLPKWRLIERVITQGNLSVSIPAASCILGLCMMPKDRV